MNLYQRFWFWMVTTPLGERSSHHFYSTIGPAADRLLYRLSGGRLMTGTGIVPMLLLTTTGRRTGLPRTTPVVYLQNGREIVLVASNVGNAGDPQWFRNLLAKPEAELSVRGKTSRYKARIAGADDRAALWRQLTDYAPTYAQYQRRAGRGLPVVVMTPAEEDSA